MTRATDRSRFTNADGTHVGHYTDPDTGAIVHEDGQVTTGHLVEPATNSSEVAKAAELLRVFAEHFAARDWAYTREHDIRHIRYDDDFRGYDAPHRRLYRAARRFVPRRRGVGGRDGLLAAFREADREEFAGKPFGAVRAKWKSLRFTFLLAKHTLATSKHTPDGVLDNGGVIVQWEETGEYLDLVQPQVGSLIADFLDAEPDNPHARKIAAAMLHFRKSLCDRVYNGYEPETDEDEEGADDA
ncbi:hypothetical protein [Aeromicrobium sp. 179-A 4D2 NHS]|uniref:hypothetical protein n=1 Tax=Aeromicrobium sp. 179-A 4D2 NHS TaxID=3142375 RepID=UPI0039A1CA6E